MQTIQSNEAIEIRQEVFYFEVKIINCSTRCHAVVGLSEKEFPTNKQLGSSKKSYGYKSDGKVYNGNTTGEDFGPKFEQHDVVGCGLLISKQQIFFTLNGRYLGAPFKDVEIEKDSIFASVCL